MSYCNVDFEWEAESYQEIDNAIKSHEEMLKILEQGEYISPKEVATIVNYGINDDTYYCFCQCKMKDYKRFNLHWRENNEPQQIQDSMVSLYCGDMETFRQFIYEYYERFVDFELKGLSKEGYFKVDIPYSELIIFLKKTVKNMICDYNTYREEFEELG